MFESVGVCGGWLLEAASLGWVGLYLPFLSGVTLGVFLLFFVLAGVCWACCFGLLSAFGAFLFLLVVSSLWGRPGPTCGALRCSFLWRFGVGSLGGSSCVYCYIYYIYIYIYIYFAIQKKNIKIVYIEDQIAGFFLLNITFDDFNSTKQRQM